MNLTLYTDYSLRVLIYVALKGENRSSVTEISEAYGISRNHVVKVVHRLGQLGHLKTVRGRNGGLLLGRPESEINLGELVRQTEPSIDPLDCFDPADRSCAITPICGLKGLLGEARDAFFGVLDQRTLADVVKNRRALVKKLAIRVGPSGSKDRAS